MAVLSVMNKRGSEAFEQADEELLRLFCVELESLLRSKSVEVRAQCQFVTILTSDMVYSCTWNMCCFLYQRAQECSERVISLR